MNHEFPSEAEYLAGRTADGSRPRMHSSDAYEHEDTPLPGGDESLSPSEVDRLRAHYQVDLHHFQQIDLVCQFSEAMIQSGLRALTGPRRAPEPATSESAEAPAKAGECGDGADATNSAIPALSRGAEPIAPEDSRPAHSYRGRPPYSMDAHTRTVGEGDARTAVPNPQHDVTDAEATESLTGKVMDILFDAHATDSATPVLSRGAEPDLRGSEPARLLASLDSLPIDRRIMIGERGSKLLLTASAKRAELAHKLVEQATQLDTRKSFLQDRAVAVVYATLLHMNDGFKEVGFGSWMPFRFPDQWLSFCGIMRRVLAANGLIHSEHAESYRKLLEETPEPESSGEGTDRVRETQTPGNLASGHENRGVNNMTELQTLLQGEIWKPEKPPPRKQYAR